MASAVSIYDCLIIGAGPAGLSAALGLGRQIRSALVFDAQRYRNDYADRMHNVLTWDHKTPAEFRAAARENIQSRYDTIKFKNAAVASIYKKDDGTFEVTDIQANKYQGKKIVLASGVSETFPDIKGFSELWGKSIFHCLFCHGFEERGAKSAGILADGFITQPDMILHVGRMILPIAENVTVYCHGNKEMLALVQKEFEGKDLMIEPRKITALERNGEHVTVRFEDGETRQEAFMAAMPPVKLNESFHEQLGLELDPMGHIKTHGPFSESSVPGVFAVGDCATFMRAVPQASAMGAFAAGGVVAQLGARGKF
ncbi:uncharacterized protein JN550_003619 [Neoarthrinium moseri]|uniref:uncharacterized protein n=1 Tax=Neoarthrinium moseri TaxID=1658444 RepID=UPI001FDDA122|nr:uncharacterized protein JN550_003619 [Neoarthrinium moseri]KAI1872745.1 hypothetical protein JN550_003619 [Neoarthrinium moseri]